jgi:hypothetical protein
LEGRLALSFVAHHPMVQTVAVHTASTGDDVQEGDFQGQFGDQRGTDAPSVGEQTNDGPAEVGQNAVGQRTIQNNVRQTTLGARATSASATVPHHQAVHFASFLQRSIQVMRHRR